MLIILDLLLMLSVGRCADDQIFETTTVGVGEYVTLKCPCKSFQSLFWIRLIPGNLPEVLGKALNSMGVDSRIRTTDESGAFVLRINKTKLSDAGVYFCMQMQKILTFLKGADLRVEEPQADMTTVPPPYQVRPGGSVTVTVQSSVLSDSENKTCPGEKTVCCFRSESDEFHPSFTVIQAISVEEQKKYHNRLSTKNCTYSFSKNISFLDAGTYCCAVATRKEIFCGDKSKPNTEVNVWDSQKNITILSLLCAALAISLIVIAFLMYSVMKLKKKSCGCCNAAVSLQANAVTVSADHQSQQTDEASLVYSAPNFTKRKVGKAGTRDAKTDEEETIYTNVRVRLTA
ncbi:uncharacterized protein LOC109140770 isoform X2 [Larimichthys crocea]|uniref:uncharacterized protein LOC109140770 isoform X2 n=1 Tax=Larimichthys crocea TaxID=215358 RepID=UPI000F5F671F|nr:uncharacterized protein LOC109140770 isoform X2 [Larimichthys crocea]